MVFYVYNAGIRTAVGEQRSVTLEDGTRVALNTDTQLIVRYDIHRRSVSLKRGEAFFEVTKDAARPFVVSAQGQTVTAVGTAFIVKNLAETLAVTLVEGKVTVAPQPGTSTAPSEHDVQTLTPGEQLVLQRNDEPKVSRPEVEKVTAWRRGRVEMDHTPLHAAAEEMNRYSSTKVRVDSPEAQVIPVTGSWRSGDVASFAETLARACNLKIERRDESLLLIGVPSANCR
jgi:transmembrane sensor